METPNSSIIPSSQDSELDPNRYFNVVKDYKNTEEECILLRNRINILKFNEQRNHKKL